MKKLILFSLVLFAVFVIYLCNMDKKIYYLALGNSCKYSSDNVYGYSYYISDYLKEKNLLEKYLFEYSSFDKKIPDIINDINSNKKYKNNTLKNSLIKADLVTLSISGEDVFDKIKLGVPFNDIYDYIDELTLDFENLIKLIRQYCKEDIIFIGYSFVNSLSNGDDVIDYYNKRFKEVCEYYDVVYVIPTNINNFFDNFDNKNTANDVIKIIHKRILKG